MNKKQRRNQSSPPIRAQQCAHGGKKDEARRKMQEHIGSMVGPGVHAAELHVRQPAHKRKWLPVLNARVAFQKIRREGPSDTTGTETLGEPGILANHQFVIKI
jgi:hypothetical protein